MSDNNININTPDIGPYTQLRPFRFWCQKVLPLVYDESLSYYELLCKVVDYLNKTMEDVDQMIEDMGEFKNADTEFKTEVRDAYIAFSREVNQAVEGLESYMNNYFNNLNVQTEINNKLDAMAEAGYFDTLFTTLFTDDVITEAGSVTSAWIAANLLQETGYVIDNSLTVENAAADAKATGLRIGAVATDLLATDNIIADVLKPSSVDTFTIDTSNTYTQCVFGTQTAGKYAFVIRSATEFHVTKISLYSSGNSFLTDLVVDRTISNTKPMIVLAEASANFNRFRVYADLPAASTFSLSSNIYSIAENANGIKNACGMDAFIGNFHQNKAAGITWIQGYGVYSINLSAPRAAVGYYIANLSVNKGDIIKLVYRTDSHALNASYIALSEKINYGSGAMQYGFSPLIERGYGEVEYVAEKDMEITICGQGSSYLPAVTIYSVEAYAQSADFAKDRYNRFAVDDTVNKLAITKASYNGQDNTRPKPLSLLHFSDIHNSFRNAEMIKEFIDKYGGALDDAICTGDMAGQNFSDYKPIYSLEDYENILLCIGNHDVYDADGTHSSDSEAYWATNLQKYTQYFAPTISNWDVTQPEDAATNGLCYYYKDYESNGYGYRLIVLDAMAFDNDQYNWLVSVLADAVTEELTVVIAEHFPPISSRNNIDGFDTPFMSLLSGMEYNYVVSHLTAPAGSALDAVDTFITSGGEFACWLCGHMHYDLIGTLTTHPNQLFIAIGTANYGTVWCDQPRTLNTPSESLFNIIAIDPYLKVIKIERIGAVVDDWGRMHDHVSINYETKELIATS